MRNPDFFLPEPYTAIHNGDCRELAKTAVAAGAADLVFADPPFNQGENYSAWMDRMKWNDYLQFTRDWLSAGEQLLSPTGSFWVNCPDQVAARVVVYCEDVLGLVLRDWCVWHYRFGQNQTHKFIRSKVHVLHFVRDDKTHIWDYEPILELSDRATKYNDPRIVDSALGGKRVPFDVWYGEGFCRIQGNNKERWADHDNQLPEHYLARVIQCSTKPTSLVVDMFAGSGTTLVVSRALGRPSVGFEIGAKEAESAFKRVIRGSVRFSGEKQT